MTGIGDMYTVHNIKFAAAMLPAIREKLRKNLYYGKLVAGVLVFGHGVLVSEKPENLPIVVKHERCMNSMRP